MFDFKKAAQQFLNIPGASKYAPAVDSAIKSGVVPPSVLKSISNPRASSQGSSRPEMAAFRSLLNEGGGLGDQYKVAPGSVTAGQLDTQKFNLDQDVMNAMKGRALSTGESPWMKMQMEKQGLMKQDSLDEAMRQNAGAQAAAQSQLAMRGGLGGGARERIATSGMSDLNATRQGIARQGLHNATNLGIADDQQKVEMMKFLPQMELQQKAFGADLEKFNIGNKLDSDKFNVSANFDADKFNMGNTFGQFDKENQFNAFKYGEDMRGWSAEKTGKAIENSGK